MKHLIFLALFIGSSFGFADASWKRAGEYFETKYFRSLYENDSGLVSQADLDAAFVIYEAQAKNGDSDAMLRLASMYEQSNPSKTEEAKRWFKEAGAQGNEYGRFRFERLDKKIASEMVFHLEEISCENYGPLIFRAEEEFVSHVESLAVLGQGECMLALGQRHNKPYWFHRALFTISSKKTQGKAAYQLARLANETLAWLMGTAAQAGDEEAIEWYDEEGTTFSTDRSYVLKPVNFSGLKDFYQGGLAQTISSNSQNPELMRVNTVERIANVLAHESNLEEAASLIDAMLILGSTKSPTVLQSTVKYLDSKAASLIPSEKRLQILQDASLGLQPTLDLVSLAATLIMPSIGQIENALIIRRRFSNILDIAELDQALIKARGLFFDKLNKEKADRLKTFQFHYDETADSSDQSLLEDILKRTQESKSSDLLLFFFNKLFDNEISQLEYLMRLEDLCFGLKSTSNETSSVFQLAQILSDLLSAKVSQHQDDSALRAQFAKLTLLKAQNLKFEQAGEDDKSELFAQTFSTLGSFASAVGNHRTSGFYFWNYGLSATFSNTHIGVIVAELKGRTESLTRHASDFAQSKLHKGNTVDAHFAHQLGAKSVQSALNSKKENFKHYIEDLLATQKALDAQQKYDSQYTERQTQLKDSKGLQIFKKIPGLSESYQVSPADAKMSPDRVSSKGSILYSHKNIRLQKNEILEIRVSGEWSPTCAIHRSPKFSDLKNVHIGPEGFRVHFADSDAHSSGDEERHSTSQFKTISNTHSKGINLAALISGGLSVAAGALFVVPGAQGFAIAAFAGAQAAGSADFSYSDQETSGRTTSEDKSTYHQNSHSRSETAAFQSGLRLPHTPFPGLPAGAYIAIVVSEEGGASKIIEAFALQFFRTYVASQKLTIYFVVNDCLGTGSSGSLTIDLQVSEPASTHVASLMEIIQSSLRKFGKKGKDLVKEGGDLGSRIETLKADVIADLEKNSHSDFMAEPTLRSVFFHWLNLEADKIIRQSRLADLARQIRITGYEIDDLSQYLAIGDKQDAYLATRLGGLVQHANYIPLYESQSDVVDYATKFVLPLLQLYYPHSADGIRKTMRYPEFFNANKQFDFEVAAKDVGQFAEQILQGLASGELRSKTDGQKVVRIPRPGRQLDDNDANPAMSEGRRRLLWDHLFKDGSEGFGLQLTYADLYEGSGRNKLALTSEAPIIEDMVMGIGVDGSAIVEHLKKNMGGDSIDLQAGQEFGFPLVKGPRTFLVRNEGLLNFEVSIGYMNSESSVTDSFYHLHSEGARGFRSAGRGLSPFTALSFGKHKNLNRLQSVLGTDEDGYPKHLTEIVIAFQFACANRETMNWLMKKEGE